MSDSKDILQKLSDIFEKAVGEVISTVSGIMVNKAEDAQEDTCNYAGILPLYGDINGVFIVKSDENSLRTLTAGMTGAEAECVEESEMMDCIGELANMICGLTKARAYPGGTAFSLSTPFSVKSNENMTFSYKKKTKMAVLPFSSEEIKLNVRIILV